MDRDEGLAREVCEDGAPPALRIYGWDRPAVSVGRRQSVDEVLTQLRTGYTVPGRAQPVDFGSLPVVRRSTGGGAVLHRTDELTYALAISRMSLTAARGTERGFGTRYRSGVRYLVPISEIPGAIHRRLWEELVSRSLVSPEDLEIAGKGYEGPYTLCFSAPVCGDLLLRGEKVGGSALRSWREGFLIQGSLQGLPVPSHALADALSSAITGALHADGCASAR